MRVRAATAPAGTHEPAETSVRVPIGLRRDRKVRIRAAASTTSIAAAATTARAVRPASVRVAGEALASAEVVAARALATAAVAAVIAAEVVVAAGAAEDADAIADFRTIGDDAMTSPSRLILSVAVAAISFAAATIAAQAQQKFKTPEEAVTALVAAVRANNVRDMILVLGPQARDILISGDEVADQTARAAFLVAYDLKHQIQKQGDGRADLMVGRQDWQLPIPLVNSDKGWQFDAVSGRREVLFRRVGRNELSAIQALLAYVDAQNDYASMNPQGLKVETYAQHIISNPGKKDGLYWPAAANEPQSPLGEAFATATIQGYRPGGGRIPYHGYYYKVLTAQGPNAPGGAMSYLIKGHMVGGFGLVAWPAEYGNSGVMTFMVTHAGAVLQKDFGPSTARIASRMTEFNPDQSWRRVDPADIAVKEQ